MPPTPLAAIFISEPVEFEGSEIVGLLKVIVGTTVGLDHVVLVKLTPKLVVLVTDILKEPAPKYPVPAVFAAVALVGLLKEIPFPEVADTFNVPAVLLIIPPLILIGPAPVTFKVPPVILRIP